jgi:hypothetical protein
MLGVAVLGAFIGATGRIVGSTEPIWPQPAESFRIQRDPGSTRLTLAFRFPDKRARTITLRNAGEQASFTMERAAPIRFSVPNAYDSALIVELAPAGAVVQSRRTDVAERTVEWRPDRTPQLADNIESIDGAPAEASVNETDLQGGVRRSGVPVRSEPRIKSRELHLAQHGDRLTSICWTLGDLVTTDLFPRPQNKTPYESDVWFGVQLPSGAFGYIPDVRYSRSANAGKLGVPKCSSTNKSWTR